MCPYDYDKHTIILPLEAINYSGLRKKLLQSTDVEPFNPIEALLYGQ